jgi:hypothetical protein
VPVVSVVDTNCDPDVVDWIIPGNDDALRAIRRAGIHILHAIHQRLIFRRQPHSVEAARVRLELSYHYHLPPFITIRMTPAWHRAPALGAPNPTPTVPALTSNY